MAMCFSFSLKFLFFFFLFLLFLFTLSLLFLLFILFPSYFSSSYYFPPPPFPSLSSPPHPPLLLFLLLLSRTTIRKLTRIVMIWPPTKNSPTNSSPIFSKIPIYYKTTNIEKSHFKGRLCRLLLLLPAACGVCVIVCASKAGWDMLYLSEISPKHTSPSRAARSAGGQAGRLLLPLTHANMN